MRRLLLLSACCLVLVTVGCSGDDGEGKDAEDKKSGSTEASDPEDGQEKAAKIEDCDAEVTTKGAFDDEWGGEATVRTGGRRADAPGPEAVFTLSDKQHRVALYSPGPEFKGSVSLSVGQVSYSSDPADAESLDIDERGMHAEAKVTLMSTGGETIDLDAEFTCGTSRKKD
jgi:hypothetical protein